MAADVPAAYIGVRSEMLPELRLMPQRASWQSGRQRLSGPVMCLR